MNPSVQQHLIRIALFGSLAVTLQASTFTWDGGGGDNSWGTLANWNPDLTSAGDLSGASLVFHTTAGSAGGSATTPAQTVNNLSGLALAGLTFSGFPSTSTGWTLSGTAFTLHAGGITVSGSTTGKSVQIENALAIGSAQTWTGSANSPLTLSGNLSGSANVAVTAADDRIVLGGENGAFTGNISGNAITLLKAASMIGGNLRTTSRLTLSGAASAGTYAFSLGTDAGQVDLSSSGRLRSRGDGDVAWDPGKGGSSLIDRDLLVYGTPALDLVYGNSSGRCVISGENWSLISDNNGQNVTVSLLGAMADDGTARTLTLGASVLAILRSDSAPADAGNTGNSHIKVDGAGAAIALSNPAQLPGGKLTLTTGRLILDGITWADFLAARPYGTGNGQWSLGSGGGLAGRTEDLTIDRLSGTLTFDRNFGLGDNHRRYGEVDFFADKPVVLAVDTTLTSMRTLSVVSQGASVAGNPLRGVVHRITGDVSDNGTTKGSLLFSIGTGSTSIGEVAFSGAGNTWHGASRLKVGTLYASSGPGGLLSNGGLIHFDDTELGVGETSFPHGNSGSPAYLANLGNNDGSKGGSPNRGFLLTGNASGRTYTLPANLKFVLGDLLSSNMSQGLIGGSTGKATLSNSDILCQSATASNVQYLGLLVRESDALLTFGDTAGPVRLQRSMNAASMPTTDPGIDSAATAFQDAVPASGVNAILYKLGAGTLALGNLAYTLLDGSGDRSSQYRWLLGSGGGSAATGFISYGAIRETGTEPSNSISGNPNLGNTKMQGCVIELGQAATFSMQLGTGSGQLDMRGISGGGFAAVGGRRTVSLVNSLGVPNGELYMSDSGSNIGFLDYDQPLILGSTTSDNTVEITNPIRTDGGNGGAVRYIATIRGTANGPEGVLSGSLTGNRAIYFVGMSTPWGGLLPAGTVELSGNSPNLTAPLHIQAGALLLNGSVGTSSANAVTVYDGATLGGTGTVARTVSVLDGANLRPGSYGVGTLTVSGLSLGPTSLCQMELGTDFTSDRVAVLGDLTVDGTVEVTAPSGFVPGRYVLMTCTGTLSDHGMTVTELPSPFSATVEIDGGEVALRVSSRGGLVILVK